MKIQIMKKPLVAAIAACAMGMTALPAVAADDAILKRMEMLEKELMALKESLQQKEEKQLKKGVELKKGTRFQFGGFVKADAMWSDASDGGRHGGVGDDFLVPSVIPTGGDDGDTYFDAHAKHSRVWMKTTSETDVGTVIGYVETDFNSQDGDERLTNQSHSGLRHAFLKWNYEPGSSLLAGQTWSTFFNTGALPESVDFVGPTSGTIFVRQEQVRWTKGLGDGSSLMFSLENPSSSTNNNSAFGVCTAGTCDGSDPDDPAVYGSDNDYDNNDVPDMVARYNGKSGGLSYSAAVIARQIGYEEDAFDDEEMGTALSLAGSYSFDNGDNFKFMLNHGNLGRYIALNAFRDAALDENGDLELIDVTGGFVSYKHNWNSKLRSTLTYAYSKADNPDEAGTSVTEEISNTNFNLIYSPTPKLSFGAEYIMADRELENGNDGDLKRFQVMGKWAF